MQFKTLVLAAMATAAASGQTSVPDSVKSSVLNVLVTALPISDLQAAATNQAAFIADIASSVSAGKTPDWYKALPADVKTLLTEIYPVSTAAPSVAANTTTAAIAITSATSAPVTASTGAFASSGSNSTALTSVNLPTLSSTSRASTTQPTSSPKPAPAGNGASVPTAALGSGVAGALGFLALLLL